MIRIGVSTCPYCGGALKHYDSIKRIVRTKKRVSKWVKVRRLRCISCNTIHNELPDFIFPHKQYEAEIILGVLEGFITSDTLGYENYPCEATMNAWIQTINHS